MPVGEIIALWRYPIKSMQGEQIDWSIITDRGLLGDRAFGIQDRATGHIASAKHPRKWSKLFRCRAAYTDSPQPEQPLPPIQITLPNGDTIRSDDPEVDARLSHALGRDVTLVDVAPPNPTREANRTPVDDAQAEEIIRQEALALAAPAGTFFDHAPIHILTTATLEKLHSLHPDGQFEQRRFRPNIVITPRSSEPEFVEIDWLGHPLHFGDSLRLQVIDPTPRCVVTTLEQDALPRDLNILRTITRHSSAASVTLLPGVVLPAVVGVYADVLSAGSIQRGETACLMRH